MSRNTIAVIWAAGIVLALIVYVTGPDRFVFATFDVIQQAWWSLQEALLNFSIAAFDLVRALAIGLYFVFVALAILTIRRGGRGRAALVAVSLVFFSLIWRSVGEGFGAHTRWMTALLLTVVAALSMTRRLTRQDEPSPWHRSPMPPRPEP